MEFKNLVHQATSLEEASTRDYESVLNYVVNEKPLKPGSYSYIWHVGDFGSLKTSSAQSGGSGKPGFFENIVMAMATHRLFNVSVAFETCQFLVGKTC